MKTLVLYSTTYGYAEEIAQSIAAYYPAAVVQNIQKNNKVILSQFDHVILGGSVYMGKIHKDMTQFAAKYENELLEKKLGLFLCCLFEDKYMEEMQANFSAKLIDHAYTAMNFGGKLQTAKMNFLHKTIMKMVSKSKEGQGPVNAYPERVEEFVRNGQI
jgi:menaquinone-dependent protoporphyrinogen oxidase